jgi:hypothetical protein
MESVNTDSKSFDIISDMKEIKDFWPVSEFLEKYNEDGLKACAVISLTDQPGNADRTAVVTVRMFLENGARAAQDQKFITAIRFYSFGDMATIDLISLDKPWHRDICYEHIKRFEVIAFDGLQMRSADAFSESTRAPFLFVGGHMKIEDGKKVHFTGESGDYGTNTLFTDGNSLAAYIASVCGVEVGTGDALKGEGFVKDVLEIMLEHKTKKDFYETLVEEVTDKTRSNVIPFTAQQIGGLIMMKVLDRNIAEDGDLFKILVHEVSGGGLARAITVNGVVKRIREAEEGGIE